MEVRLHRFVLAEFNTHRTFSRNSASSRAIPVGKQFVVVAGEPAVPLVWASEQKGMQGGEELPQFTQIDARKVWLAARDAAVHHAEQLVNLGVHKSITNRLLEPFLPHTVIVSSTDWDDFWTQRASWLAQPEIRAAAEAMRTAYDASTPRKLHAGSWHMPYVDAEERSVLGTDAMRVSAARCARVSYLTHDGRRDIQADLNLYRRLVTARPPHWSPLEHVATPAPGRGKVRGNFKGWHQLRHQIPAVSGTPVATVER